jgi:hypothetical protein
MRDFAGVKNVRRLIIGRGWQYYRGCNSRHRDLPLPRHPRVGEGPVFISHSLGPRLRGDDGEKDAGMTEMGMLG